MEQRYPFSGVYNMKCMTMYEYCRDNGRTGLLIE
jgi:hypothetical protein